MRYFICGRSVKNLSGDNAGGSGVNAPARADRQWAARPVTRRDALRLAGLTLAGLPVAASRIDGASVRKVAVAGGGIAGLCCAYELSRRAHEVTVLEASKRTGGHVMTYRGDLEDGLYADAGAEHFTRPGYDLFWQYVKEFDLPYVEFMGTSEKAHRLAAGSTPGLVR